MRHGLEVGLKQVPFKSPNLPDNPVNRLICENRSSNNVALSEFSGPSSFSGDTIFKAMVC